MLREIHSTLYGNCHNKEFVTISEKSRPHLQSTVERPGNGDALGLGLARRDGSLQLVQVTVLLQLLYQALEKTNVTIDII